ncbi:MAG: zf-HC2 domain-containing protein [Acidobacteria bacterium]|nr:zf-HC2 domain-containing protein [Acidobacteriota bacterium]
MKSCKQVQKQLPAFLTGGLSPERHREVEQHLKACADCRFELELLERIASASETLGAEGEEAARDMNWDALETRIFAPSRRFEHTGRFHFFSGLIQGALAVLVLIPVLLVMVHTVPGPAEKPEIRLSGAVFERMETHVARQEVRQVLSRSRLLLSEFMEQCPGDENSPFSWQSQQDVRELMAKNRMLRKDLNQAQLQNARGLCRKLDMVFSEMASVSRKDGCRDVTRLQKLLRREHIFLKIRLVEEELRRSEG